MSSAASRALGLDVSAYVIRDAMVDTGLPGVRRPLVEAARSLGVRGVLVTHWHEDHAGNVEPLVREGLPMRMHPDTETRLRFPPSLRLYRRIAWGTPPVLRAKVEPFEAPGLEHIATPGHSPDHHVVWDHETGTLFSGDLWLGVRARAVHTTEDPYQIIESLSKVRALAPARMFDAHRGEVVEPIGAITAKIEWFGDTLGAIERSVQLGLSDRAIVNRVLGGEELAAAVSIGEYARRNLVAAVRRRLRG
ncbi:MAG TPA: MBL fold metallo-hydrolase [Gemmatimonadaceae bacterium]|nr:MBL fold metallo-hydrolase [Gemmatimonadaceae bacterium]